MPIPRSGPFWRRIFIVLLIAVSALFVYQARTEYPHGGSTLGIAYGIAVATFVLVAIVIVSGVAGAILYVTVPRLLTEVESNLTVAEISDQLNQLAKSMARIASGKSAPFQRIYTELVRESQPGWLAGWRLLFTRRRQKPQMAGDWSNLIGLVGKEEQEELRQMLVVSRQRKELLLRLIYQQRYKNILEAWLYVHVPFTIAAMVLAVVHVAAVFYYRKVG